tara:strand:- start:100 stop:354 length:255 start_codon:yes stop_codon:yes gene_type:complete
MTLKQDDLNRELHTSDRDYFSYTKDFDGKVSKRVSQLQTYSHKQALLIELQNRGIDINTLPLLVNNKGVTITFNDGSLIYTEVI